MKYFRNTELAKLYNVSEKSVRNWIDAALEGKLDLQLYKENDRTFVANTSKNTLLIEELVVKGKKYRNSRGFKMVRPSQKFYELYTEEQIFDIISNLEVHREIPHQYSYADGGAESWDHYTQKLLKEGSLNSLTNTIQLLSMTQDYLFNLVQEYERINIIDIGVGNCLEIRALIENLCREKTVGRYICLDVSKTMLKIAQRNLTEWFGDQFQIEGYVRDIHYDRFNDLLSADAFGKDADTTANIVLFLGGTISNFREPERGLGTIQDSMGKNDFLITSKKLDTESSRRYFDFTVTPDDIVHDFRDFCLELLNLDKSFYTVEQFFDKEAMCRKRQVRLNVAVSIEFQFGDKQKTIEFNKGEAILLWRASHQNAIEAFQQLDNSGFNTLQATRSKDTAQEYVQFISQVKTNARSH